jgi:hypothetical protein
VLKVLIVVSSVFVESDSHIQEELWTAFKTGLQFDGRCHCKQVRIQKFLVGDNMDEEKIGRGLRATVGSQRGPGAEPLVVVKKAKPPMKETLFSRIIQ